MSEVVVTFSGRRGEQLSILGVDRLRDALADYCAERWPIGRRKEVARAFRLSAEQARAVIEGRPANSTMDQVWREGGWTVVLPVFGKLLGEGVDQFIERERRRHAENAARLSALVRDLRPVDDLGAERRAGAPARRVGDLGVERRRVGEGGTPHTD